MSFVNLHAHSHYSLLDGFGSPEAIILRAKELGYPAAALTDHGVTYGLIEFYNKAKKHGIKPILGCEIYIANRTRFDKEAKVDVKPYHMTLLAKNNEGYNNLLTLVTKAHLEGFYYKPRVDYGLLKAYGKGLVALSGCVVGHLPRLILAGKEDEIHQLIKQCIEIFGKENYYLELQDHPLVENQLIVNERLKQLAKQYDLQLVVTNDSHYPRPEDAEVHDILLCIQTGTNVNDENRMRYVGDYSIRDVKDLKKAFEDCPQAIENTLKIADQCNVDFEFDHNLIPSFKTPNGEKPFEYLKMLAKEGFEKKFPTQGGGKIPKEYKERFDYEIKTVHKMGFDTYFLIVQDFINYAKNQKIVVGPGRGSAAGSILSWSLGITELDPIKYGLFFERFLNPERISMPDIDIDFADTRRDEVLNYVIEKYGRENVAQIITFGTMAPKAAVKDTGRALGYPYKEVDFVSKTLPAPILGKQTPLEQSIQDDPDLHALYESDPRVKVLLDYAKKLEGTVRQVGTHACAVVISEEPLVKYTALQYGVQDSSEVVTQYSAKPLEDLGLLKMDFLGLKNLTVIERAVKIIKRTRQEEVDIEKLPLDDEKTFELFQKADTTGVFQFESAGMKRYLKQLKPTKFEDITAMGALYRPGPMEWIPTYIKGKHNSDKVKYLHESFRGILESTYGVAVYQEQILQLARDFAGFSLGEADLLRKAVGKKIPSLLQEQREKFIKGAIKCGHKKQFADEVFEKVIEPFAGYGFNKAHAACYAMIAYQTAYLKAHYPIEFMTALLCSDAENTDRVVLEIKECSEMGIDVLPPSINESFANFTVLDEKTMRFGLMAIKGVGESSIREIIEIRDKTGSFKSLEDFAKRVSSRLLNKKLIQALAHSGALDEFGDRNQIAESHEEISKYSKHCQNSAQNGQTDIFGILQKEDTGDCEFHIKSAPKTTLMQKLKWEKELLGLYVSGHPLRGLKKYISRKVFLIGELTTKQIGKQVQILGLVSGIKKMLTKSGIYMAMFTLEDPSGKINVVMFPSVMSKFGSILAEEAIIAVSGKFDNKRGTYQVVCENAKLLSLDTMIKNAKEDNSYDPDDKSDIVIRMLDDILEEKLLDMEGAAGIGKDAAIEDFDISDVKIDETNNDSFVVKIPSKISPEKMKNLKEIFETNKGETSVEIYFEDARKRMVLPFKINPTEKLKSEIEEIVN